MEPQQLCTKQGGFRWTSPRHWLMHACMCMVACPACRDPACNYFRNQPTKSCTHPQSFPPYYTCMMSRWVLHNQRHQGCTLSPSSGETRGDSIETGGKFGWDCPAPPATGRARWETITPKIVALGPWWPLEQNWNLLQWGMSPSQLCLCTWDNQQQHLGCDQHVNKTTQMVRCLSMPWIPSLITLQVGPQNIVRRDRGSALHWLLNKVDTWVTHCQIQSFDAFIRCSVWLVHCWMSRQEQKIEHPGFHQFKNCSFHLHAFVLSAILFVTLCVHQNLQHWKKDHLGVQNMFVSWMSCHVFNDTAMMQHLFNFCRTDNNSDKQVGRHTVPNQNLWLGGGWKLKNPAVHVQHWRLDPVLFFSWS